MTVRPQLILCAAAAVLALVLTNTTRAAVITYDLAVEFSGGTAPAGATPWLRATFDDGGSSSSVTLTLTALNLTGGEFVSEWNFNLDPSLNPANLIFSSPTKTGTFANPTILTGVNAFQADGDGLYDIQVAFDNAPPANRFTAGESVVYTISGISSLTANSFNFLSAPAGGKGPFPTAAHVQGIGAQANNSGWVTVPEPASAALLLIAAAPLCLPRRRLSSGQRL